MKLQLRLTILFSILALLPLVLVSYLGYLNQREALLQKSIEQLRSVAEIQEKRVNEKLDRYIEQVKLITSRTQLRATIASYRESGEVSELEAVDRIIRDAVKSTAALEAISIVDLDGGIIASTNEALRGVTIKEEARFVTGQEVHELSDIYKDDSNVLKARLVGPFILNGETIAVAEVIASADTLISVTEDYTGLGETGEVVLAQKNSAGDALFITPLRFDAGAALTRAIPRSQTHVPMVPAVSGVEDIFIGPDATDYRGEPVFAVTRFIDALEWGLVIKIDQAEALAPIALLFRSYISIVSVSIIMILVISWLATRTITRPIDALTIFATRLATGKFDGTVEVQREDEIGFLAQTFNKMAKQLAVLYSSLEQQVKDQTKELEKALTQVKKRNEEVEKQREATLNVLEDLNEEKVQLQEAKAKDEAILANMGDGLVVTDMRGVIVLVNKMFEEVTGFTKKEAIGRPFTEVVASELEDGSRVPAPERSLIRSLNSKTDTAREVTSKHYYVRKDGTRFPVDVVATPITINGDLVGAVEIFRDITLMMEVDKAKTEFVSLASHQLRTPLSTINWYSEMLVAGDAGKLTKDQKQYVNEIYVGNQRMVDLVNALLDVSRIELGTFVVEPEPINVAEVVQSIIQEQEPEIFKRKQRLEEHYDESIPEMMLDPKLFRIVVQNLISNAIKYTPEKGSIDVTVTQDGSNLLLKIADTGMGIPEEQKDKIFGKLFRADNVKESDTTGTGLGLYLAKSIVEHSAGKIWFESREDEGTTFYVTLPLTGMKQKEGTKELGS